MERVVTVTGVAKEVVVKGVAKGITKGVTEGCESNRCQELRIIQNRLISAIPANEVIKQVECAEVVLRPSGRNYHLWLVHLGTTNQRA